MENLRKDIRNRLNGNLKQALGSWLRLAVGIFVSLYINVKHPAWFQPFAFAYGLYFVQHLSTRVLFKQRIHQIGNEVAIMAICKKLELWDGGVTEQVNEYFDYRSLDIPMDKVWKVVRARDW